MIRAPSPRQVQVLAGLAAGLTGPEIAVRLGLAGETVRSHTEQMRVRYGVRTQGGLVALALRSGWIE